MAGEGGRRKWWPEHMGVNLSNGNRLFQFQDAVKTDYAYGENNEMTASGSDTWTYDHFGNTKTKVSGGNTTTFNWDFESHLTSIDYPNTANDDTHEYDGHGMRMRSKLAGAADWTNFIYDELNWELLMEYTLISGTYLIKSENTWGLGLISTNREGTKRYFHFDALGSTWALTGYDETILDTYSYAGFGNTMSAVSPNGPSINPFRYVGRWGYYDDGARGATGGYLLLSIRYWSSAHGRFLSRDPLPGFNEYCYVDNHPTRIVDPFGAQGVDCNLLLDWRCLGHINLLGELIFQRWCYNCLTNIRSRALEMGRRARGIGIPEDPFRHCWAACTAVRECGCCCAMELDLREWRLGRDECMDIWNNKVGRSLGGRSGSCFNLCVAAIRDGRLIRSRNDPRCYD